MAITKLTKHDCCEVKTIRIYDSPHYGELRCRDHNVHIQWLSKEEYKKINKIIYSTGYNMA
jgi:hypothetical protein